MRRVDANAVDNLGPDSLHRSGQALSRRGRQDARCDGDSTQIRHLVGSYDHLFACSRAGACPQNQVEAVLGVDGQAADLGAVHLQRPRDVAGLLPIAVQAQRYQVGGSELDRVPFQDNGSLRRIAAAQDWRSWLGGAKGLEDAVLERAKLVFGSGFLCGVAANGDVHDTTGGDIGRQQDGRELNLYLRENSNQLVSYSNV